MTYNERALTLSRAALIRGAAASAAALALPHAAFAQSLTTINAAGVPEDSSTAVLWAQESGIFRRHGLSVNLTAQRSGAAIAAGVAGGSYEIAKSSIVPLIVAHTKGIPFVLVAPGGINSTANEAVAFVVKADSPIRSGADLNGKTIAVSSLNDLYAVGIKAWVDRSGGDSSTLQFVELPLGAVPAAIEAGRVAGAGLIDPVLQSALDGKGIRSIGYPFDAIAPAILYTAWFTTRDYAASHADVVKGFIASVHTSAEYCNAHPSATSALLSSFSGVPLARVATMRRATLGTSLDPKLIQPMIETCAKYKVIPAPFAAEEMFAPGAH